jgi:hypothetical protein
MTQPPLFTLSSVSHSAPSPVVQERARRSRQRDDALARLERGSATNIELSQIALRYSARIEELRKDGYRISSVGHGRDWTFTLLGRH